MSIVIAGFSDTNKVPGFYGEVVYGAGPITAGDIPLVLLICGTKISTGSATADVTICDIFSETDADTYFGAGSEIAVMCYGALQIEGVKIKAIASAEAGGAAAGTATITLAGSYPPSATGTFNYRIDGVPVTGQITTSDTLSTAADAVVNAINAISHLSVTAAKGAGPAYVVTLTRKSKGARGNQGTLCQDTTQLPSGVTSAIAGGSSLTNGGVFFTGGSGTDNVSNVLTVLASAQYDRIAAAQNDATNAVRWSNWLTTQAGVLVGHRQHACFANNASLAASTTIAQTSINAQRCQYLWYLNSETIPSYIAATFMAYRTQVEQTDPAAIYDGYILPGVYPQTAQADWATRDGTMISALNNSITPIGTNATGGAYIVRSITTKSLTGGGSPDYRTLDTSQAVVPDYVLTVLDLYWTFTYQPNNKRVDSDPAQGQRDRPAGVATPARWNQQVNAQLLTLENQLIITDVASNPAVSEFNSTAHRIMSIVPVVPAYGNHQIGISVRQTG